MTVKKYLPNETCPHCGSTRKFDSIQQKIYAPPITKRKLIARIDRCLDCNETFGTVSKYQARREFEDDV